MEQQYKNNLLEFDMEKLEWKEIFATGKVPDMRVTGSFCSLQDRYLFLYGGWNARIQKYFGDLWRFDLHKFCWDLLIDEEESNLDPINANSLLAIGDRYLVSFFGKNRSSRKKSTHFVDLSLLNPSSGSKSTNWKSIKTLETISSRTVVAHAFFDSSIYVFGGFSDEKFDSSLGEFFLFFICFHLFFKF